MNRVFSVIFLFLLLSIFLFIRILLKIPCKTFNKQVDTSMTSDCQTCIANCGAPPKYPNTDATACNTYNDCILKCNMSLHCTAQPLTCGCPGQCQPYISSGVSYPGICALQGGSVDILCQPYPPTYTLQCKQQIGIDTLTSPGICSCSDGYYLFGPIVDAKPGLNMDCSKYPNTQAVCGCIDRNTVMADLLEPTLVENKKLKT